MCNHNATLWNVLILLRCSSTTLLDNTWPCAFHQRNTALDVEPTAAHIKNGSTEKTEEKNEEIMEKMWGKGVNAGLMNKSGDCGNESQLNGHLWTGAPYGRTHTERPARWQPQTTLRKRKTERKWPLPSLSQRCFIEFQTTVEGRRREGPRLLGATGEILTFVFCLALARPPSLEEYDFTPFFLILLKLILMNCRALHQ